ncbi:MAG TPA: MFS transporter [Xanthobacteraceae bacterium]|nr:MFS transporter [Xanthobacteraceae bacterium]
MTAPSATVFSSRPILAPVMLLWLAGIGLRITILAVPPVIPLIHVELGLTETQVGVLTGLPPLLFALAAVPGSLLIARLGAVATAVIGLVVTGFGGALRGAAPNAVLLFAATILTGLGVAVMHPSMPSLVRHWLPSRIGFGTALYTNGLLVGEIVPVAMTIPLLLPLVGGSWRLDLAVWSVPAVLIALVILALAPRRPAVLAAGPERRRWWPDWNDPLLWRLGVMLGTVNAGYFSTNAFLPDYLTATGQDTLISGALTGLNLGQLPASFLLLAFAGRLERRLWPYVASGLLTLLGFAGVVLGSGPWVIASTLLLGFALASVLILVLALPPLLSAPENLHRLSAAMFTISYSCAVVVPIISGLAWDVTGVPRIAFAPMAIATLLMIALTPTIDLRRKPAP